MKKDNARWYDGNLITPLETCSIRVRATSQGMDPQLRRDVWKYLLNYVPFHANHAERDHIMATKRSVITIWRVGKHRGADNQQPPILGIVRLPLGSPT